MAHVYKVDEWQSPTGKWWVPARMLGMSLTDYILLLKDEFKADIESYYEPTDVLLFSWKKQTDCHRYVLWINAVARKANYIV